MIITLSDDFSKIEFEKLLIKRMYIGDKPIELPKKMAWKHIPTVLLKHLGKKYENMVNQIERKKDVMIDLPKNGIVPKGYTKVTSSRCYHFTNDTGAERAMKSIAITLGEFDKISHMNTKEELRIVAVKK